MCFLICYSCVYYIISLFKVWQEQSACFYRITDYLFWNIQKTCLPNNQHVSTDLDKPLQKSFFYVHGSETNTKSPSITIANMVYHALCVSTEMDKQKYRVKTTPDVVLIRRISVLAFPFLSCFYCLQDYSDNQNHFIILLIL